MKFLIFISSTFSLRYLSGNMYTFLEINSRVRILWVYRFFYQNGPLAIKKKNRQTVLN